MKWDDDKRNDLQEKIEDIRGKLILSIRNNGINHPNTLDISHKLDEVLNAFERLSSYNTPHD